MANRGVNATVSDAPGVWFLNVGWAFESPRVAMARLLG
jgi:hypothetical protein